MSSLRRVGRFGAGWPLLRLAVRVLRTLDARLAEQNAYLQRLADEFAPVPPAVTAEDTAAAQRRRAEAEADLGYFDPVEAAVAEAFCQRMRDQQGREPSDEEVLSYMADAKSVGLQIELNSQAARRRR